MDLIEYLEAFPPTCVKDLHEAFLFGVADSGEYLQTIGSLRLQGFASRQIVVCLTKRKGRGAE